MSGVTTHVLDTSVGHPAAGMSVSLERAEGERWELIGRGETDADGRLRTLVSSDTTMKSGVYRLTFATGAYFARSNTRTFYSHVTVTFDIIDGASHYHVPLLIGPFGYTTYRGS